MSRSKNFLSNNPSCLFQYFNRIMKSYSTSFLCFVIFFWQSLRILKRWFRFPKALMSLGLTCRIWTPLISSPSFCCISPYFLDNLGKSRWSSFWIISISIINLISLMHCSHKVASFCLSLFSSIFADNDVRQPIELDFVNMFCDI